MKYMPALVAIGLSACAVGPNYKEPAAPQTTGFTVPGALPSATVSAPLPGGEAQRFVDGLDIPGQWWTLFKSPDLNALIERGLAHSPTLEAAQATPRPTNDVPPTMRMRIRFPPLRYPSCYEVAVSDDCCSSRRRATSRLVEVTLAGPV